MLIVSGQLYIRKGSRQEFLEASYEAMILARKAPGCKDFVVAADPVEPERVNVYEVWESEEQLLDFRGSGPDNKLFSLIERANVSQHVIASSASP